MPWRNWSRPDTSPDEDVARPSDEVSDSTNRQDPNSGEGGEDQQTIIPALRDSNVDTDRRNPLDTMLDGPLWNSDDDATNEERRREAILEEINRRRKSNFSHFLMLCLIPTFLLVIVVASIVGEDQQCGVDVPTTCMNEPRSFINAFTTRCICDAVIAQL